MRILITGGTGLIGRRLCRVLLAEGHEVTVFSRNPGSVAQKCGAEVHALATLADWTADKVFDSVINLAGEPIVDARWTERRKQVLRDSRIALTEELVRRISAAEHKPSVLLSGSAIGYYGGRGDEMLEETSGAGTDFPAQLCVDWEAAALAAEKYGVRVCLLRTGLILSKDGGLLGRMVTPFRMGMGARLGDGRQWMSWIHIDDYAELVLRLLRDEQMRGPYDMTSPVPVTNKEFTATLAAVLHRPAAFVAPASLLKLSLGEAASLLLEGQRVMPKRMLAAGQVIRFIKLEEALKDLYG
ncbi:MAG: TIGR01777 family protein [Nitrosomonadales bacterium]|nr:TIGR01777 family protein [Nitrosomonadales bacterium]